MRIILLGPPGAGKGTQAKALAGRLKLTHISTGDILRSNVRDNTTLGREAKEYMEKGLLVPDELVTKMLMQRFSEPDTKKGFILDGYPRNINQAKLLDKLLAEKSQRIDKVVYLDTSESVIIQRLTGRLICSQCQAIFHVKNLPPKKEGVCDKCQGRLYQRPDDAEETVKKRLEVYKKEVAALLNFYESQKILQRVSADEDAEVVLGEIIQSIQNQNDTLKV